jgi:hypothetical protein
MIGATLGTVAFQAVRSALEDALGIPGRSALLPGTAFSDMPFYGGNSGPIPLGRTTPSST